MAIILSSAFTLIYGRIIIRFLKAKQIGESVRDLGLDGQNEKAGTPTMGGIIIILATLIPVFLLLNWITFISTSHYQHTFNGSHQVNR